MPYYAKKQLQKLERWTPNFDMKNVSVSHSDLMNGSPKEGDMIASNPKDESDRWLVSKQFVEDNYHYVGETLEECGNV